MSRFADFLREMENDAPERPKLAPDIEAIRLRDALASYNTEHVFKPGMIVRQKPQASVYNNFGHNNLAIVVEVLKEPIMRSAGEGGSHYREIIDMKIGSMNTDDNAGFPIFHVDSRRFEPVEL